MNIIKISDQVFEMIQNDEIHSIDSEHLPYPKLCIAFPYNFLRSYDDMIADNLKEFKHKANRQGLGLKKALEDKKEEIQQIKEKIIKYCNSDIYIMFNIVNFEITIEHSEPQIIGKDKQILFNACKINAYKILDMIPLVKINEMSNNGIWLYNTMIKLVSGVIFALNNPYFSITEDKQKSYTPTNKKHTKNNIRYISNIKSINQDYIINNGDNKKTYNMEAWEVRGHWRQLPNGLKVWVNPYVKGDKEKFLQIDTVIKMNKINI